MIPTKSPGTLFDALSTGDSTLNVRWYTATDPVFFEVFNRPLSDVVVRQLVLAKAIDTMQLSIGHSTLYPFIVQPQVSSGTSTVDVPLRWIWDINASLPKKWENLRLSKIKRISGSNGTTSGYTGSLRLIFTANIQNSSVEVAVLYADYDIDSSLTYQPVRLTAVPSTEETSSIDGGELETVTGFVIFKTLDESLQSTQDFYDLLEPPTDLTLSGGIYVDPAEYEIVDSVAGGTDVTGDYATIAVSHGTGLLTDSAWSPIPNLDSDVQSWITSFNYPFDSTATRKSNDSIIIPIGLFKEFNITAPAGDKPTGDISGTTYPVWLSRIESTGTSGSTIRMYFSTYNVTDSDAGGTPSTEAIEFATLDLSNTNSQNDIVEITPYNNLLLHTGTDSDGYDQHFGRGHVVLSSVWDGTTTIISDFFDEMAAILDSPADTSFNISATRISSFGISRVPKYTPTMGQSHAMMGSTSRRTVPIPPSYDNRFITEQDQGLGNQIDLDSQTGITPSAAIERYGYQGSLAHRIVKLVVDASQASSDTFYETHILPRLTILLGRPPVFGDIWANGTRFMFYNGDAWVG